MASIKNTSTGKLPGKTAYSGRRRSATRRSGFKSHPDATGGQCRTEQAPTYALKRGEQLTIRIPILSDDPSPWLGYGGWFWYRGTVDVRVEGGPQKATLSDYGSETWNKVGSVWERQDCDATEIVFRFKATEDSELAIYQFEAGNVHHNALEILSEARDALAHMVTEHRTTPSEPPIEIVRAERFLGETDEIVADQAAMTKAMNRIRRVFSNNHDIAPEAAFYTANCSPDIRAPHPAHGTTAVLLKTCNRCARYLPINPLNKERFHLSFSNHCVAADRRPCKHTGFGKLTDENGESLHLDFGYQLECRYCKKYFVNTVHNRKRTAAQMKEDGTRRRNIELLLAELYQGSPQLRYRVQTNRELTDDVWNRFEGRCFNCNVSLKSAKKMNLDHTRPLKLLWPLDRFATALCGPCNNAKRDRPPVEFYTLQQLDELSEVTGCPLDDLENPSPNIEALKELLRNLDWFFDEFLMKPEMTAEREGKVTGELLVRALQKVVEAAPPLGFPDLSAEYNRRR